MLNSVESIHIWRRHLATQTFANVDVCLPKTFRLKLLALGKSKSWITLRPNSGSKHTDDSSFKVSCCCRPLFKQRERERGRLQIEQLEIHWNTYVIIWAFFERTDQLIKQNQKRSLTIEDEPLIVAGESTGGIEQCVKNDRFGLILFAAGREKQPLPADYLQGNLTAHSANHENQPGKIVAFMALLTILMIDTCSKSFGTIWNYLEPLAMTR